MKRGPRGAALAALASATLLAQGASAYCRTTSCRDGLTGQRCDPPTPGDCGIELAWKSACVGFSMQQDASRRVDLRTATQIFRRAFARWVEADCGDGTTPRIRVFDLGPVECDEHVYNQQAPNQNVILFHDDEWPYAGGSNTLALTTVTYNLETGEIYDADMEINTAQTPITTTDTGVLFDLESIAVHEAGHFLGLAHSADDDATMYADYRKGSTSLRDLSPDDVRGICAAYPPGEPLAENCDPTPRHGFSTECRATRPEESCCTVAPGGGARGGDGAALGLLALGVAGAAARRRARR